MMEATQRGVYATSMMEATLRGLKTQPHQLHPFVKMLNMGITHVSRLHGNTFYGKAMNLIMELGKQ
jgi:hypothetical protein